ncbi:hypothetical protein V1478_017040 [Vespula squamosa]|uniref:Maturase K n=1 Tax=Vespula squamosa TaxID=30214 RepID=A0ABD1ZY90_VESSQ
MIWIGRGIKTFKHRTGLSLRLKGLTPLRNIEVEMKSEFLIILYTLSTEHLESCELSRTYFEQASPEEFDWTRTTRKNNCRYLIYIDLIFPINMCRLYEYLIITREELTYIMGIDHRETWCGGSLVHLTQLRLESKRHRLSRIFNGLEHSSNTSKEDFVKSYENTARFFQVVKFLTRIEIIGITFLRNDHGLWD